MPTQADIDAIDAEIASVRTVKSTTFVDQSVTFRDLAELYAERARLVQAIAGAAGTTRTRYATTSKGV